MDKNVDNILKSIKSLPKEDQIRILYFLEQEQVKKELSPQKEKEVISFMSEKTDELERWNKEIDDLLKKTKQFFNELDKTI